jgi:hypothetical protein
MLNADAVDSVNCVLHLGGIIAILRAQVGLNARPATSIALLILGTDSLCEIDSHGLDTVAENIGSIDTGTAISPHTVDPEQSGTLPLNNLVAILPRVSALFRKATAILKPDLSLFESQLTALREEAVSVRSALLAWFAGQSQDNRAVTVQRFTQPYRILFPDTEELICTTLRADAYTDRKYTCCHVDHSHISAHLRRRNRSQYVEHLPAMPTSPGRSALSYQRLTGRTLQAVQSTERKHEA